MSSDAPAPWAPLLDVLRADSPIAVIEESERELKRILTQELAAPLDGARIRRLAAFQRDLGFILKYKSYAVKAVSPLGYAVFLQRPGEGFSFQQHVTHKTEIFYILEVRPGGFVFLCDFADWQRIYNRDTFLAWMNGAKDDRYERFRFTPRPGDVVVIDRLNVVHSVVGCVLAEFATVSTDMVDRLHDQNEGRAIPKEFTRAFSEDGIRGVRWPDTSHQVTLGPDGWSRKEIASHPIAGGRKTTLGDDDRFSAALIRVDSGGRTDVVSSPDRAIAVHVANGAGQLLLGTADEMRAASLPGLAARAGDLFLVPPHAHYAFRNDGADPMFVAEHRIAPAVAFV